MEPLYACAEAGPADAPTILLVHGAGVAGWMWHKQVAVLKESYHCLIPDLPDHGQSRSIPFAGMEAVAGGLMELIRAKAHGGKAIVIGHSLGAKLVAFMLALPDNGIEQAVIASALFRPMAMVAWASRRAMVDWTVSLTRVGWLMRLQEKVNNFGDAAMDAAARAETANLSADGMFRYMQAFTTSMTLPPALAGCAVPVLVVHASAEGRAMAGSVDDLLALNPGFRAVRIRKANHLYPIGKPELFNHLVLAWIDGRVLDDAGLDWLR